MALVDGVFDQSAKEWRAGPNISLNGLCLPLMVNTDEWLEKMGRQLAHHLRPLLSQAQSTPDGVTEEARLFVRRQLTRLLRKKPVVLVKLHIL